MSIGNKFSQYAMPGAKNYLEIKFFNITLDVILRAVEIVVENKCATDFRGRFAKLSLEVDQTL